MAKFAELGNIRRSACFTGETWQPWQNELRWDTKDTEEIKVHMLMSTCIDSGFLKLTHVLFTINNKILYRAFTVFTTQGKQQQKKEKSCHWVCRADNSMAIRKG